MAITFMQNNLGRKCMEHKDAISKWHV